MVAAGAYDPDYGVTLTPEGIRAFARMVGRDEKIRSASHYVGACRRLATREGVAGFGRHDGRLVAVGWNHETPRQWVCEGGFDRFMAYWREAAGRPDTVGSPCNPEPGVVYQAMRRGVPASITQALGQMLSFREGQYGPLPYRSLRRLRWAARAARRTSIRRDEVHLFALRTLTLLGRMSPELQRVAVEGLRAREEDGRLRLILREVAPASTSPWGEWFRRFLPQDLPWEEISRAHRMVQRDSSGRVRVAMARGRRRLALFAEAHPAPVPALGEGPLVAWLTPGYPRIRPSQAARLVLGESPVDLSAGGLSKREAHQWLSEGGEETPLAWFVRTKLPEGTPTLRDWSQARWLAHVHARGQWEALLRERTYPAPGGQVVTIRFIDRVDEITEADLDRGPRTGVVRAFESAAQRQGEAWLAQHRENHRVLQSAPRWKGMRCMTHLNTPAMLVAEGDDLAHCVGGYIPQVESGEAVIYGINVLGHRSTVELSPTGEVRQHYGEKNSPPHHLCYRALHVFLRRNNL